MFNIIKNKTRRERNRRLVTILATGSLVAALTIVANKHNNSLEEIRQMEIRNKELQSKVSQIKIENKYKKSKLEQLHEEKSSVLDENRELQDKLEKVKQERDRLKVSSRSKANNNATKVSSNGEFKTFEATAYNLRGKTASGTQVRQGVIAVDPKVIPLGSKVEVKFPKPFEYMDGIYIAEDTGGVIKGAIIDVWMPNNTRQFGRRDVKVKVIK